MKRQEGDPWGRRGEQRRRRRGGWRGMRGERRRRGQGERGGSLTRRSSRCPYPPFLPPSLLSCPVLCSSFFSSPLLFLRLRRKLITSKRNSTNQKPRRTSWQMRRRRVRLSFPFLWLFPLRPPLSSPLLSLFVLSPPLFSPLPSPFFVSSLLFSCSLLFSPRSSPLLSTSFSPHLSPSSRLLTSPLLLCSPHFAGEEGHSQERHDMLKQLRHVHKELASVRCGEEEREERQRRGEERRRREERGEGKMEEERRG